MGAMEVLVADVLAEAGLERFDSKVPPAEPGAFFCEPLEAA